MICEKSRKLYSDLLQENPSTSTRSDEFKAGRGWLDEFHKRSGTYSVMRHGEVTSSDKIVAEAYKKEFTEFTKEEGYIVQAVFNYVEPGIFWNKILNRNYITQEEKSLLGHNPMKGRWTLFYV